MTAINTHTLTTTPLPSHAIGIFDSGVGGLSVMREIRRQLPHESLIYFADSAHAPYGEKPIADIQARTLHICQWLHQQAIKALVIACNTATAHVAHLLRARYPNLPIIGVEPGLKPAQAHSTSGIVGVLATTNTLKSDKFRQLIATLPQQDRTTRFICQAGTGLVELIEQGEIDSQATEMLLRQYLLPMRDQGADTLVLGCTHYLFLSDVIRRIVGTEMHLIDTSSAIARQLQHKLTEHHLLAPPTQPTHALRLACSMAPQQLQQMVQRLLHIDVIADLHNIPTTI